MNKAQFQSADLTGLSALERFAVRFFFVLLTAAAAAAPFVWNAGAQTAEKNSTLTPGAFRVGEKLTYNVSFERFKNAGYAEIAVVSRGRLDERDAVELQSVFKTYELVSAAFYLLDESRTTYAAAETGLPLPTVQKPPTG